MKPILLHYYITNRCNARCTFCSIWHEQPKQDAKLEEVRENLKQARQTGCSFVDFTGGEPLLHPDLPAFLKEAKKLGFITSITTNCLLFPQRGPQLKGLVDLLHFSIDADSAEAHDAIRGCTSFDKVMESIDIALSHKLYPDLLYTYTAENINLLEGVYRLAREKKLIVILDPVFDTRGPDQLHPSIHNKAFELSGRSGIYLNKAHLLLRKQGGNHVRAPLCRAVSSTIVVLPNNKLALPCFHHRSETIDLDSGLLNALQSETWKNSRLKEGTYSFCEGCHINCYFDPSYQYRFNRFFQLTLLSKLKYTLTKYVLYRRPLILPSIGWKKR